MTERGLQSASLSAMPGAGNSWPALFLSTEAGGVKRRAPPKPGVQRIFRIASGETANTDLNTREK